MKHRINIANMNFEILINPTSPLEEGDRWFKGRLQSRTKATPQPTVDYQNPLSINKSINNPLGEGFTPPPTPSPGPETRGV